MFLIVSCQATPPTQIPEANLASLEEQLHLKLNAFIGSDQEVKALSAKSEIVYMVDVNTGYAYSSDGRFTQLNMYTEGPDGVMRNKSGQVMNPALQRKSVVGESSDLSVQATQHIVNFAPYRHVETKEAKWKRIEALVVLGDAYEFDQLNEAAFNLVGIRAGAWTMEAGVYANSYTWNRTYRWADYWGAFFSYSGPDGIQRSIDYGILATPVPGHPVILFKPATSAKLDLYIDAPYKCRIVVGGIGQHCGYPKGTNTGYLVFEISGRPTYPVEAGGKDWTYKFIYDTSNIGFSTTFQGNW